MNTSLKKRYYIIPVFYIFLTLLLFYTGMNHSSNTFSIKKGPLKITGTGQEGLDKNSVKSLTIDIPGLKMSLTKNPLYVIDSSGNRRYLKVTGFSCENNRLRVSFTDSVRLTINFNIENKGSRILNAAITIPSDGKKYVSVYIPARAGYAMKQLSFLPSYTFSEQGVEKLYVFGSGSTFDTTAGVLSLSIDRGNAYFSLYDTGKTDALSFYFFGAKGPVQRGTYEALVEKFLDNGYTGWKKDRFDARKGEWTNGKGEKVFSNDIVAAFIAESLKRGRYSDISKVLSAIEKHGKDFSFLSAPYAGNIVKTDEKRSKMDDLLKKEISSGRNKSAVFLHAHLIEELNWISSSALYRAFNSLVASLDLSKHFSPEVITGMVDVYRDVVGESTKQYHDVLKLYSVIESALYPDLIRTNKGLFLLGDNGYPDIFLSVKAGEALFDIGQINNDSLMTSIGRTLVASSLSLQKADGWLPSFLDRDGNPRGKKGFYGAEIFYSDLTDNEFYPHLIAFNEGTAKEIRIWTAAKDIALHSGGNALIFDISFPRGISHHLVIKGISPFEKLEMHGIPWNSDRRFQYYTSGWVYKEQDRTLYMKLNQRKNKEQVIIRKKT